jgi:hypothetical protein
MSLDQTTIHVGDRVIHPDTPQHVYTVTRLEHDDLIGPVAVLAEGQGFWRCSALVKVSA